MVGGKKDNLCRRDLANCEKKGHISVLFLKKHQMLKNIRLTPFAKRALIFLVFLILGYFLSRPFWGILVGLIAAVIVPKAWLENNPEDAAEKVRSKEMDQITSGKRSLSELSPEQLMSKTVEALVHLKVTPSIDKAVLQQATQTGKKALSLFDLLYSSAAYANSQLLVTFQSLIQNRYLHAIDRYLALAPDNKAALQGPIQLVFTEIQKALETLEEQAKAKQLDVGQDTIIDAAVFAELERRMTDLL